MSSNKALGGILIRRERWGLSWIGWLIFFVVPLTGAVVLFFTIEPFLAAKQPVTADVLVVEGWVPQFAIKEAVSEFTQGGYRQVYTTGGPITGMGGYTNDYNTSASLAAGRLGAAGIPAEAVQMVPSRVSGRDRTYASAVALRDWFRENGIETRDFNIITESAHARRTRLLFEKAFGSDFRIGVIAVPNPDYDPKRWWRYSEGVKDVTGETIAYLYARLVFH